MSYDVVYENLDDPKTVAKAIKDIQQFIGKGKRWEHLLTVVSVAVGSGANMHTIRFLCGFAGIQGYPVTALVKHIVKVTGVDMPAEEAE